MGYEMNGMLVPAFSVSTEAGAYDRDRSLEGGWGGDHATVRAPEMVVYPMFTQFADNTRQADPDDTYGHVMTVDEVLATAGNSGYDANSQKAGRAQLVDDIMSAYGLSVPSGSVIPENDVDEYLADLYYTTYGRTFDEDWGVASMLNPGVLGALSHDENNLGARRLHTATSAQFGYDPRYDNVVLLSSQQSRSPVNDNEERAAGYAAYIGQSPAPAQAEDRSKYVMPGYDGESGLYGYPEPAMLPDGFSPDEFLQAAQRAYAQNMRQYGASR